MKKIAVLLMTVLMIFGMAFAYDDEGTDNPRIIFDNKTDMPKVDAGEKHAARKHCEGGEILSKHHRCDGHGRGEQKLLGLELSFF